MFIPKTLEELEKLIEEKIKENADLEFKKQLPDSGKNDDLAKDICAMSNSGGGVLIYGVKENEMGQADELSPFDISGAVERINLVSESSINESVKLEKIHEIQEGGNGGYLVVVIPNSNRTPHFVDGTALGRNTKGNRYLSRREIGELFVQSDGFAQEFNIKSKKRGRIKAYTKNETYQKTDSKGRLKNRNRWYLILENDGSEAVFNVNFDVTPQDGRQLPQILTELEFPISNFPSGHEVAIQLAYHLNSSRHFNVETVWIDKDGSSYEEIWTLG